MTTKSANDSELQRLAKKHFDITMSIADLTLEDRQIKASIVQLCLEHGYDHFMSINWRKLQRFIRD